MPLPVAHGLIGASIAAALHREAAPERARPAWLLGAALANVADLDFFFVWGLGWGHSWHRGFTHSLAFVAGIALLAFLLPTKKRAATSLLCGLAVLSHVALDYSTSQRGAGLEALWPVTTQRYKLDWFSFGEFNVDPPSKPLLFYLSNFLKQGALELLIFVPLFLFVFAIKRIYSRQ